MKRFFCWCTIVCVVLVSCSDSDDVAEPSVPDPTISGFTPSEGILGNTVTITGENFSPAILDNVVQFDGVPAQVQSATSQVLTVTVPDSARTGQITVTVGGKAVTSDDQFEVLAPTIESVDALIGSPGLSVTITGSNFSTSPSKNRVTFGGEKGVVTSSTGAVLEVEIPEGATTGKIIVQVGTQKSVYTEDFFVCTDKPELVIKGVEITSTNAGKTEFSFRATIWNAGSADLDLSKFVLQNWVSADQTYGGGDLAAGGTVLDAGGILSQGETYDVNWSSSVSYAAYPYLITQVYVKNDPVAECDVENNVRATLIE